MWYFTVNKFSFKVLNIADTHAAILHIWGLVSTQAQLWLIHIEFINRKKNTSQIDFAFHSKKM